MRPSMAKNTGASIHLPAILAALALIPLATAAQQPVAITNVTVISMADTVAAPARTVIIQGGRIAQVGSAGAVRVPPGARVVDGTGKYSSPACSTCTCTRPRPVRRHSVST